ncbi:MAG: class I SAM-dependent methyltransferase [Sedimentisphaerales bacterium]|nr:class I SAM-dependent methyltransferase [Sedimentisphaerales bacterium]
MTDETDNSQIITAIPAAGVLFETGFMSRSLEQQIAHCDHYEIVNYFRKWLPDHQPILEAGCGSGRWVAWFVKNGWRATGLDWSKECCERARLAIPDARFEVGDMREMPFNDGEFGAIVSLGAVEHSVEGPIRSLGEYHRVLSPGGIAIITVPYLGPIRKLSRLFSAPKLALTYNSRLRRLLGKTVGTRTFAVAQQETLGGYAADFIVTERGWEFFQYHFSKTQMQAFIQEAGFEIVEEFVEFGDEGILHNFGRIAGTYNYERGEVSLTIIGKVLRNMLALDLMGHMLCYLVRKNS